MVPNFRLDGSDTDLDFFDLSHPIQGVHEVLRRQSQSPSDADVEARRLVHICVRGSRVSSSSTLRTSEACMRLECFFVKWQLSVRLHDSIGNSEKLVEAILWSSVELHYQEPAGFLGVGNPVKTSDRDLEPRKS